MSKWGDVLLSMSGKSRTDPYDDFTLGHLGYWTDGGSYYYHNKGRYASEQAALLATKADYKVSDSLSHTRTHAHTHTLTHIRSHSLSFFLYKERRIPVRYYQWDDWWTTDSAGDIPGIRNWQPDPVYSLKFTVPFSHSFLHANNIPHYWND